MFTILIRVAHSLWFFGLRILRKVEKEYLLTHFRRVGRNLEFDPLHSHFAASKISIGDNVFIGEMAHFGGDITIGSNVMFGPRPVILAANHIFALRGKSPRFIKPAFPSQNDEPVTIEDEVWFGANVTILGNVTVGMGAVIGAGSVVTRSIPPFTLAAGNPCRPLRLIFSPEHLHDHLLQLGYPQARSEEIVQRRARELGEVALPVVDKTDQYEEILYAPAA